ncbi:MAG: TetR/AcrR family transcriptional regulator [Rectinema sp.]
MGREKKINDVSVVIDAAMEIIEELGYKEVSTRRIASRLRISPMTLYNYYKNRDAILKGIIKKGFDELWAGLQEKIDACCSADNPLRVYLVLADHMLDFGMARPNLYRFLFTSAFSPLPLDETIADRYHGVSKALLSRISALPNRQDILNDIFMFQVLMNSLVLSVLDHKADMTADRYPSLIARAFDGLLLRDRLYLD